MGKRRHWLNVEVMRLKNLAITAQLVAVQDQNVSSSTENWQVAAQTVISLAKRVAKISGAV